ncbi:Trk1p NDAI_0G06160 [Naumovozyma dairenensis CBS 421]|uniref:Potassium transport protein n=1 Tax=Naumovozyma dairenensis (strain ATCC 10597 / BCRC 20456 / CBS 421 / NBRC 0211 / NRRL Y-12639) TaxID=1071378 RepID=J7REQ5_NAUDC|nr:hypothetical protein NDAI_0G06160 [Naumovozyma dairenensis CBS 421]CCK73599.1 hypothetical protein NDAI_0G06160 [Naumovozyma dairenensis CBS 421]
MQLRRRLSRVSTLTPFTIPYKKTLGHKLRDFIDELGQKFTPIKKYIFPNFIAVHYFYIISLTIIASILMYPIKNARYIDILFLAAGATTQGGLNTVDLNGLTLYQQLIIYLTCMLSTPIIIHGCLAFVRLYWFERYFDGIRDSSKRNFEIRRTKTTYRKRINCKDKNEYVPSSLFKIAFFSVPQRRDDFQEKLFSGKMVNRDEQESINDTITGHSRYAAIRPQANSHNSDSNSSSVPTSSSTKDEASVTKPYINHTLGVSEPQIRHNDGSFDRDYEDETENFARRRMSEDILPEDMYRSIMLLRNQHDDAKEDDGPALIVKAPTGRSLNFYDREISPKDITENSLQPRPADIIDNNSSAVESLSTFGNIPNSRNDSENASDRSTDFNNVESGADLSDTEGVLSPHSSRQSLGSISPKTRSRSPVSNKHYMLNSEWKPDEANILNRQRPTIQFDITKPPKRRLQRERQIKAHNATMEVDSPRSYFAHTRRSSRNIFKHIPKGRRIRQKIKRSLSTGSTEKRTGKSTRRSRGQYTEHDGDNEEYFADDETDDEQENLSSNNNVNRTHWEETVSRPPLRQNRSSFDNSQGHDIVHPLHKSRTYDQALVKTLDELARKPDFQKVIYEDWKAKHRKSSAFPHFESHFPQNKRASVLFKGDRPLGHPGHGSDQYSSDSHPNPSSMNEDDGYLQSLESTNANKPDIDEEGNYYGLHFDPDINFSRPHGHIERTMSTNYLSWQPTIGRNSNFYGLTQRQKDELGGVEYRAIKLLCRILLAYYIGFNIMAFVMLVPWICVRKHYISIVRDDGISPAWWGFFTAMSAFSDLGLTLTPDSMSSFNKAIYPLLTMAWFIIIGNTGFPILLRFIIWIMFKLAPDLSQLKESLGFLLDHPRRCFTLLFPSAATWWLLLILLFLNFTDLILFVILDFGSSYLDGIGRGYKVVMGLFQGVCTRTAGFSVMDLSKLHAAIQVSYMLMMYVSVLPLAISIRRTNVYEEQSLGIYGEIRTPEEIEEEEEEEDGEHSDDEQDDNNEEEYDESSNNEEDSTETSGSSRSSNKKKNMRKTKKVSTRSFIGAHLRRQLSFDLWFLFLGLFIICICENGKIKDDAAPAFNVFSILFEIVSAYGTVGLSLGYPNTNQSFSGRLTVLSKLVIIAMLIRGRNRGLPYSLDRAIMLPSDRLEHIDHIEDLKLKKRSAISKSDSQSNRDPMNSYVKNGTRWIRRGLKKSFTLPPQQRQSSAATSARSHFLSERSNEQ